MKHGKKYADSVKAFDLTKPYETAEAVDIVLETAKAKFDETVEMHVRLGVDPRQADQQVRGVLVLPNGTGKTKRVLVIAKGAKADAAAAAGADYVGAEEMIAKIQNDNWFDFDVMITTPDMMGMVGRIGRVLGPKGLMPNPKSGTVTMDVEKAIREVKAGKVEYRAHGRHFESEARHRQGTVRQERRHRFHDGPRRQSFDQGLSFFAKCKYFRGKRPKIVDGFPRK